MFSMARQLITEVLYGKKWKTFYWISDYAMHAYSNFFFYQYTKTCCADHQAKLNYYAV